MASDVQVISGTNALAAARLCNFRTGSEHPLPAHKAWLDVNVQSMVASIRNTWVDLLGHASRQWKHTGGQNSHELNKRLSLNRCEAVKQIVRGYNSSATFNIEWAKGDAESSVPNPDDGYDRAVEIYVYASRPVRPPPSPSRPPSVSFEIRLVSGFSMSAGPLGDDNYWFQIVDKTRNETAFYHYTGLNFGMSYPLPSPASVTKAGPPTPFTTTRDTRLYMFNSEAWLTQNWGAQVGPYSIGGTMKLSIREIADSDGRIFTHPGAIPIEGATIQAPNLSTGSPGQGFLAWQQNVYPFTGY